MDDNNNVIDFEILKDINDTNYIKIISELTETAFSKDKIREYINTFSRLDYSKQYNLSLQFSLIKLTIYSNWFKMALHFVNSKRGKEYINEVFGSFKLGDDEPYYQLILDTSVNIGNFPVIICDNENAKPLKENENSVNIADLRICALRQLDNELSLIALNILLMKDNDEIKKYLKS